MRYLLRQEFEAYDDSGYRSSPESCGIRLSVSTDKIPDRSLARLFRDMCVMYGKHISHYLSGCNKNNDAPVWDSPLNSEMGKEGGGLYGKQ